MRRPNIFLKEIAERENRENNKEAIFKNVD